MTQTARISGLIAGQQYEVRVRGKTLSARSQWVTNTFTVSGDTIAPSAPTSFAAIGLTRSVSLSWVNPIASDLSHVEIWERSTAVGAVSAKVGESRSNFFVRDGLLPNESRLFKARAVDQSGNVSGFTAEITGTAEYIVSDDIQAGAITSVQTSIGSNVYYNVGSYNDLLTFSFNTTAASKRVVLVSVECSDESSSGVANSDSINWQSYLRLSIAGTVQSGEVDSVCQFGTTTAITWSFLDSTSRTGSVAFVLQGKAQNFGGATRTTTGFRDPTMTILEFKR